MVEYPGDPGNPNAGTSRLLLADFVRFQLHVGRSMDRDHRNHQVVSFENPHIELLNVCSAHRFKRLVLHVILPGRVPFRFLRPPVAALLASFTTTNKNPKYGKIISFFVPLCASGGLNGNPEPRVAANGWSRSNAEGNIQLFVKLAALSSTVTGRPMGFGSRGRMKDKMQRPAGGRSFCVALC